MKKRLTLLGTTLVFLSTLCLNPSLSLGAEPVPPPPAQPGAPTPWPPAAPTPEPPGNAPAPALEYVAPGVFAIGQCKIIKAESKVEFPAAINMREGLLEYLLVGSTGKLHESLLRTEVTPYALQVALLLSGLEGSLNHLEAQGENKLPEGDPIDINVRWQDNGKDRSARIEDFVLKGKDPVGQVPWVFTGSFLRDGVFAAQVEKSFIAVYHDPVALIDHRLAEGASDMAWFVNGDTTPAVGTPVTVSISKKPSSHKK